jgi:branched-chain amino acid transport system substrate-binding protein
MIQKRRILLISLVGFMVLAFAVSTASAEKVFKLGLVGPMTGPAAKIGEEFKGSAIMALEEIDYKIGDYRVELVYIDSQSDPAKATNAYAEAVERGGINASIFNWHSSCAVALMEVTAQYKIPHLWGFGAASTVNDKWVSDPKKYGYWGGKAWPYPAKLIIGYRDVLEDAIKTGVWKPSEKLFVVACEETDWGRDTGAGFKSQFESTGWKLFSEDYFPIQQTDFYPLMSKWKNAGVTAICTTSSTAPVVAAFIKQAGETGMSSKAMISADGLGWVGEWYKLTGRSSDGVLDMIPQLTTPAAKKWAKDFEKKWKFTPSPSSGGLGYDGFRFWIKIANRALEKHGKLDKESIFDIEFNEVGPGKLVYTADDGAIIMKRYRYSMETMPDPIVGRDDYYFPVIQYKRGKGKIVFPPDWAETKLAVPK